MRIFQFISVFASAALPISIAAADSARVGDVVRLFDREGSAPGGEALVHNLSNAAGFDFRSFCVSSAGSTHSSMTVDRISGSSDATGRQLTAQSAYLYSQFRAGTLAGYDYASGSAGRTASANELQEAIWSLEGAHTSADGQAAVWISEANAAVNGGEWDQQWGDGTLTGAYDGLRRLGDVRVMSLDIEALSLDGVRTPVGVAEQLMLIPSPDAAWLGVLGLLLVRPFVRRV